MTHHPAIIQALIAEYSPAELTELAADADVIRSSATYAETWQHLADALTAAHNTSDTIDTAEPPVGPGSSRAHEASPGWCIVELLGHRRVVGLVQETTVACAGFLRIDELDGRTQLVSPGSVYALHPTTEEVVRRLADRWRTEPVARYELEPPAGSVMTVAEARAAAGVDDQDDDGGPF